MLPSFLENSSRVAQRPAQAQVPIHRPSSFQFTFATWRPCRQCTQRKRVLHAVSHRIAGSARCQQAVVSRATVRISALASSNPTQPNPARRRRQRRLDRSNGAEAVRKLLWSVVATGKRVLRSVRVTAHHQSKSHGWEDVGVFVCNMGRISTTTTPSLKRRNSLRLYSSYMVVKLPYEKYIY